MELEKFKELLISMGLSEELTENPAFDIILKEMFRENGICVEGIQVLKESDNQHRIFGILELESKQVPFTVRFYSSSPNTLSVTYEIDYSLIRDNKQLRTRVINFNNVYFDQNGQLNFKSLITSFIGDYYPNTRVDQGSTGRLSIFDKNGIMIDYSERKISHNVGQQAFTEKSTGQLLNVADQLTLMNSIQYNGADEYLRLTRDTADTMNFMHGDKEKIRRGVCTIDNRYSLQVLTNGNYVVNPDMLSNNVRYKSKEELLRQLEENETNPKVIEGLLLYAADLSRRTVNEDKEVETINLTELKNKSR